MNTRFSGKFFLLLGFFLLFFLFWKSGELFFSSQTGGLMTEYRFLALGDSYTIGESVSEEERWPVQLVQRLKSDRILCGAPQIIAKTGWTTDELLTAIHEASPQGPFDLVSLLIGVNNQYRGRSVSDYREEFLTLLRMAIDFAGKDPSKVVVLSIPDWGQTPFAEGRDRLKISSEIDAFNQIKEQESKRLGVAYVEITTISRKGLHSPSLLAVDGLHPSGEMYREWVRKAYPKIRKCLKKSGGLDER